METPTDTQLDQTHPGAPGSLDVAPPAVAREVRHERFDLLAAGLLRGLSVEDAGAAAKMSRSAAYRALDVPYVQDRLREGRARHLDAAARSAAAAAEEAVSAVLTLMRGAKSESTRLRAAEALLAYSGSAQALSEQDAEIRGLRTELDAILGGRRP